jgi:hypothetical protein
MLLVDLMHEFELGVWRALFIHLLRMLDAANNTLIQELDRRFVDLSVNPSRCSQFLQSFRQVPTFGRDSVRRFSNNVSELKRLAARDYENLLQVRVLLYSVEIISRPTRELSVRHTGLRWTVS